MSSYLAGAGRNTATATATATYGIDIEIELLKSKSASASVRPSSSSSSTNSTLSESSNYLSPGLSIRTRKPRTPRKRPNQTYNEAAALLSSAYPNLFDKPSECSTWLLNSAIGEEEQILLPLALPEKLPQERRLGLLSGTGVCSNYNSERLIEDEDFETESILDEELGGIDDIMGNLTVKGENLDDNNLWYGIPMGLGLGLGFRLGGFEFGRGVRREVRALRNPGNFPAMKTVEVEAIAPRQRVAEKKKKKAPEAAAAAAVSVSDCRIELKLNYEEVLSAWSDRGSPYSGESPASEVCGGDVAARLAQIDLFGEKGGARKASVQRYKDKRRTRLSSNKIRCPVKKVDADQQLRTKGRFVKRADPSADVQT